VDILLNICATIHVAKSVVISSPHIAPNSTKDNAVRRQTSIHYGMLFSEADL